MLHEQPAPDADFDLLRGNYKEVCAQIADLEAGDESEREPAEKVMLRFGEGLPQNADGLVEAHARAQAHLNQLTADAG